MRLDRSSQGSPISLGLRRRLTTPACPNQLLCEDHTSMPRAIMPLIWDASSAIFPCRKPSLLESRHATAITARRITPKARAIQSKPGRSGSFAPWSKDETARAKCLTDFLRSVQSKRSRYPISNHLSRPCSWRNACAPRRARHRCMVRAMTAGWKMHLDRPVRG